MKNKGFTLVELVVTVGIILIGIAAGYLFDKYYLPVLKETAELQTKEQVKKEFCNHDYVTTSRRSILYGGYRVYSKCTKCGNKI